MLFKVIGPPKPFLHLMGQIKLLHSILPGTQTLVSLHSEYQGDDQLLVGMEHVCALLTLVPPLFILLRLL